MSEIGFYGGEIPAFGDSPDGTVIYCSDHDSGEGRYKATERHVPEYTDWRDLCGDHDTGFGRGESAEYDMRPEAQSVVLGALLVFAPIAYCAWIVWRIMGWL